MATAVLRTRWISHFRAWNRCFVAIVLAQLMTNPHLWAAEPVQLKAISPENGSINEPVNPTLCWTQIKGAISYKIQIVTVENRRKRDVFRYETKKGCCVIPGGYLFPLAEYQWRVKAITKEGSSEWSAFRNFKTKPICETDDVDCDGISDRIEKDLFKTDDKKKTLFVRPLKEKEDCENREADMSPCVEYWKEFSTELFPGNINGHANIKAFADAGIEVVVIGDPNNPYLPMTDFLYDPAKDDKNPPCDILEVTVKRKRGLEGWPVYCLTSDDARHKGHTYFMADCPMDGFRSKSFWSRSIIGYTTSAEKSHKYYKAFIYSYPLDRYFNEGAYQKIEKGERPIETDCTKHPGKCNGLSPFNLNDDDPFPNPPYTMRPDETVEFNEIKFDSKGTILWIGKRGKSYTRQQVISRIVVHEMGHSLLGAVEEDHCRNPSCIMNRFTEDWDQKSFGPPRIGIGKNYGLLGCKHGPGKSLDIRADGVVFNFIHK